MSRKITINNSVSPPPLLYPDLKPVFLAHENPWFKVKSRGTYYTIEYERPQTVVLPVVDGKSILMVRVKRPVIADTPLELPAGDSNEGETTKEAAMREFAEETGIKINDSSRFLPDLPFSEMPGRMPVLINVYRINITQKEVDFRKPHDDEIVSVECIPFLRVKEMLINGEIYSSGVIAIISRLLFKELY